MHELYSFHFLDTVSRQLHDRLDSLLESPLNDDTLRMMGDDQEHANAKQGVYLLYLAGRPVYLGKADNVQERLRQHLRKLSGRKNIQLDEVGYKALLLDKSMGTAANETVLIALFRARYQGMWNGSGFGPKDPGRNRDTTEPGPFDRAHPIQEAFVVAGIDDVETVGSLFSKMKVSLPYVFRFELDEAVKRVPLALHSVPRTADALLRTALSVVEPGWHAAFLSYGIVVYRGIKRYPSGVLVVCSGPTAL